MIQLISAFLLLVMLGCSHQKPATKTSAYDWQRDLSALESCRESIGGFGLEDRFDLTSQAQPPALFLADNSSGKDVLWSFSEKGANTYVLNPPSSEGEKQIELRSSFGEIFRVTHHLDLNGAKRVHSLFSVFPGNKKPMDVVLQGTAVTASAAGARLEARLIQKIEEFPVEFQQRKTGYEADVADLMRDPVGFRKKRVEAMLRDVANLSMDPKAPLPFDLNRIIKNPQKMSATYPRLRSQVAHITNFIKDRYWYPTPTSKTWMMERVEPCASVKSEKIQESIGRIREKFAAFSDPVDFSRSDERLAPL